MKMSAKENYEIRKKEWNDNKVMLRSWIADGDSSFHDLDAEIQAGLKKIIGKAGGVKSTGSINDQIRQSFLAEKKLSSMTIFKRFKIGDVGMRNFIKSQLLRKDAKSWIWINYHALEDEYEMVGQGAEIPADYDGWLPTEMREI